MNARRALFLDTFETVIEKPVYYDLWRRVRSSGVRSGPDPMTNSVSLRGYADSCGAAWSDDFTTMLEDEMSSMRTCEGVLDILSDCKAHGVDVIIASNLAAPYGPRVRELLGEDVLFHFSYEVGRKKPDPSFMLSAFERFSKDPQRSLFIGNSLRSDYACGQRAGIETRRLVEGQTEFSHEVSRMDLRECVKAFLTDSR